MTRRAGTVLLVTGLLGAVVGAVCAPTWQDAVELAQVHGGIVAYRPDNPFFLYAMRTWSLLVQGPALLLHMGMSERALSMLMSGAMGAVTFQALGMTVLAMSGDAGLASLAPAFIYATYAAHGGVTYPVYLAGTNYTYGVFGLSGALLAMALIAADEPRAGALVLGVLPAIHLSIACWTLPLVAVSALWQRQAGTLWRAAWRWWVAGLAITAGSLMLHLQREPAIAAADRAQAGLYLAALLTFWDVHRQPVALTLHRIGPVIAGLLVSIAALWRGRFALSPRSRLLLSCVVIAGLAGGSLQALRGVPFVTWPPMLWVVMPSRMLNLPILTAMALFIGLAGHNRRRMSNQAILTGLVVALGVSCLWIGPRADVSYAALTAATCALIAVTVLDRRHASTAGARRAAVLRGVTLASIAALALFVVVDGASTFLPSVAAMADRTNDAFMATVAARPGVLLTGPDLSWMQLRTRRPVLLSGVLIDALIYVPEVGPSMNRAVSEAYGVDLLHPPFGPSDASGTLPAPFIRNVWEARAPSDWRRLRERFGVTDIVADSDWHLPLREIARTPMFVLYAVP